MNVLQIVLGAVFGSGAATLVATVARVVEGRRKGNIESEDSVISRLETENRNARGRADEAEAESEKYRKRMHRAENLAALFERTLIKNGIPVPVAEGIPDED